MFNVPPMTANTIASMVQTRLTQLKRALDDVASLYRWTSGLSVNDLVGIGFSTPDANSILSAVSDARAVSVIYNTGLPPNSYPQPSSAYIYSTSQFVVIGPTS